MFHVTVLPLAVNESVPFAAVKLADEPVMICPPKLQVPDNGALQLSAAPEFSWSAAPGAVLLSRASDAVWVTGGGVVVPPPEDGGGLLGGGGGGSVLPACVNCRVAELVWPAESVNSPVNVHSTADMVGGSGRLGVW